MYRQKRPNPVDMTFINLGQKFSRSWDTNLLSPGFKSYILPCALLARSPEVSDNDQAS